MDKMSDSESEDNGSYPFSLANYVNEISCEVLEDVPLIRKAGFSDL